MQGFTKLQFNDSGSAVAVACPLCGKATCFCNRDLATAPQTSLPNTTAAPSAAATSSPAASVLSVRIDAKRSPTFAFQPWSGYGNTLPPAFSLDDAPSSSDSAARSARTGSFFGGGSPSWTFDGWTFALSATGVKQGELQKLIERHGGHVSRIVHKRVHAVIVTAKAVQRSTQTVRKARAKGIPMVTPEFVHDALRTGEAPIDMAPYAPHVEPRAPAVVRSSAAVPPGSSLVASASVAGGSSMLGVAAGGADADGFEWGQRIIERLKAGGNARMRRKRLRKAVLAEYFGHLQLWRADERRAWWGSRPKELKALFRKHLREARAGGRLATEGKMVWSQA